VNRLLVNQAELMRRITDLKVLRETIIASDLEPEILVAALCWVDVEIADHERDMNISVKAA
jgi:hypothetical protein